MNNKDKRILDNGINTILTEKEGLERIASHLDENFVKAVHLILACKGRIVVTGMGKSGHIGQKMAATFSSTGTPSFFMHPAEGVHGDLGMLVRGDLVIALSNSGETEEIKAILPIIKRLALPLISITGNINSTLAQRSDATINGWTPKEACPMNLAPTTSTTGAMAIGDALAVALVEERGFKAEDFALVHPSGSLGKRLLLTVDNLWHTGEEVPVVTLDASMKDVLYEISSKGFGCTAVVDRAGKLIGIVTDGDIRRGIEKYPDLLSLPVETVMSKGPKTIPAEMLAARAMAILEEFSITSLLSVDEQERPVAILHLHDMLKAGIS